MLFHVCVHTGLVIAISLTLQFNLFLEMPFKFEFPTMIFCVVLACIIGMGLASLYPLHDHCDTCLCCVVPALQWCRW